MCLVYEHDSRQISGRDMTGARTALVCGAGGFIGAHLVRRLKKEGFWVSGVDLKYPEYCATAADEYHLGDLREDQACRSVFSKPFDKVYQLAADMGGAGYIFTGHHDAEVMHNSAKINLNVASFAVRTGVKKVFFSSSACIYPEYNQRDPDSPNCSEHSAYPANPDSEYGWEKLFSERLFLSYYRNYGLNVKIARFHNIFGEEGAWCGGKEKAVAALCRKVAEADNGAFVEIWGDGKQTRSFLYVEECLDGIRRLMDSDFTGPFNIGSDEAVTIRQLAEMIIEISGKDLRINYVSGPVGVRGRNSDNTLIAQMLGWKPCNRLNEGLAKVFFWVDKQVHSAKLRQKASSF